MAKRDKRGRSDARFDSDSTADYSTRDSGNSPHAELAAGLALTILHHPDGRRVGEYTALGVFAEGVPVEVSRVSPKFRPGPDAAARPLTHRCLSRSPVWVRQGKNGVSITPSRRGLKVTVEGRAIENECEVERAALREQGALLVLGGRVLLYLHEVNDSGSPIAVEEMHGASPAIRATTHAVARVAPRLEPVFLRGEPGAGTESVAREIHRLSDRAQGPWISVDMQAIPAALAATEFFDAEAGCFPRADGGTLFVNDIGRLPADLQAHVLRTVERGLMHARDGQTRPVDVRLLTASADDLQELVAAGRIRPALAHRLQKLVLDVPPLRARRADIPLLLHRFLRTALAEFDAVSVLDETDGPSGRREWLRLSLIERLMRYSFPGNIAELRNIAEQMATYDHDRLHARLPSFVEERMKEPAAPASMDREADEQTDTERPPRSPTARRGKPSGRTDLSAEVVRATLHKNRWNVSRTARALGVSRNTLIARIQTLPDVRLARDVGREDILRAQRVYGTDMEKLADALQVSEHGLRLRFRELGLD